MYVRQAGGYRAFVPADLPPQPGVRFDDGMLTRISDADRALGRLDGSIQTLPAPDLFVMMYVRKEAVLSSQIEGTLSSLDDLLEAEKHVLRAGRPKDVAEVVNYVDAMNHGLTRLAELPVSTRLIREIHERLMAGVRGSEKRPGEIRSTQNWIGPRGCGPADAAFVPPPPDQVGPALGNLEKFIHEHDAMPLLVKVGLAHAQFETIHPFLDGNGRVGRLLIAFLLCEHKVLQSPVLYLSHYFRRHRQRYYDLLQATRDDGDWEGWLDFFLVAVAEVAQEATETARRIVALRENHRARIADGFGRGTANALRILESLYVQPLITVKDVAARAGVTFTAANSLTSRFVEQGILHEITGQARNRVFRYAEYIALFADGGRSEAA